MKLDENTHFNSKFTLYHPLCLHCVAKVCTISISFWCDIVIIQYIVRLYSIIIVLSSIQYCTNIIKYHVTEIDNWTYLSRICVKVDNKLSFKSRGFLCGSLEVGSTPPPKHLLICCCSFCIDYQLYKTLPKNKKLNEIKQRWLFNSTACVLNNKSIQV